MEQADYKRFLTLLTGVADYYGKVLSEGVISLYWEGLRQYDIGAVERSIWEHTQNPDKEGSFMPKISDITRGLQGRTEDQAALAWSKVDTAVRRVGTYSDVVFDDALIHRVIADMGGWIKLGTKDEKEWPFVAKEFENRYRGYRIRGDTPEYQPVLTGIANAQNAQQGFKTQPPMLIGHEAKAKQVMLTGTTEQLVQMRLASSVVPDIPEQQQIRRIK